MSAQPLDFFAQPLPKADVVTVGMILHDWNLEKQLHLVRAAYEALPPGGAFDFTVTDFFGWCREAGFRSTEVIPLAGPASAGVAYK